MKDKLLKILQLQISDSEKVKLIEEAYKASSLIPYEERKEAFRKKVWSWYFKNGKDLYQKKDVENFVLIWSALSADGKLMKFEKERKFQIATRFRLFKSKESDFANEKRLAEFKSRMGSFNPMR